MTTRADIKKWMRLHVSEYVEAGQEVNTTRMVEAWDCECSDGESTLDSDHEAWDIAHEVAEEYESRDEENEE